MPIKPMDMQVLLPNIRKAARPENIKESKAELTMQQQQMKEKTDIEAKRNKIANLEKKDQNAIKNDHKDQSLNSKNKKKKDDDDEDEEEKKKLLQDRSSHFDMKV